MRILPAIALLLLASLPLTPAWAEALPTLEVKHGQANNPDWLSVRVEQAEEGLHSVALFARTREDGTIAGYRLTLIVEQGEMNGLRVDVPVTRVRPGFTAGMMLPQEIAANGTLVLEEQLGDPDGRWFADGGRMYRIDLQSYLQHERAQQEGEGDVGANAASWLEYERTGSRAYAKVAVDVLDDGTARIVVDKHDGQPAFECTAELSPAEMMWFRTLLRTTDFFNPDRLEREALGGHEGITTVRAQIDGQELQARFGRDDSFDELSGAMFRLIRQAEVMKRLQRDYNAYEVRTALTNQRVLQPSAFVQPLMVHIQEEHNQLDHALIALAWITTPEQWGGVLAIALEQATDEPHREGSALSRRQLLLNVITNHPFYMDLPASHTEALLQNYHMQSAVESRKQGDEAARYVQLFKENEARLRARE
ncbi:MAG: hypothetical protein WD151_13985 [Phycisphaeraceae bacterium]